MSGFHSKILGTGDGYPSTAITNADMEKFIDTSDEWIATRTGIRERRVADLKKGESTLSIAEEAARKALEASGVKPEELDIILVGTVTPESLMPTTAVQLQAKLGAKNAFGFDLQAACSGWLYALNVANHFLMAGSAKKILVIGAETLSTIVNWQDRTTCVLFGDGAGAAVLSAETDSSSQILGVKNHSNGELGHLLEMPHGFSACPVGTSEYRIQDHKIKMQGREIFKHAVRSMTDSCDKLLEEHGYKVSDLDFALFHQANLRIINTCMERMGLPQDKTFLNLDKYGNTSAATLPTCLHQALQAGKIKRGDLILLTTFGGGLTWASALLRF